MLPEALVTALREMEQPLPTARPAAELSRKTGGGGRPGPREPCELPPPPPPPPLAEAGADKARTHMTRIAALKPPAIGLCNLIIICLLCLCRRQNSTASLPAREGLNDIDL